MRRVLRHAFTFCAAASLLLFVLSVYFWLFGLSQPIEHWHEPPFDQTLSVEEIQSRLDHYGTSGAQVTWRFVSWKGQYGVERHHRGDPALAGGPGTIWERGRWGFMRGASYSWTQSRAGTVYNSMRWWRMPCWPVTVACAVLPGMGLMKLRRTMRERARRRKGLCPECGYDLRTTPGQCPECGAGAGDAFIAALRMR